MVSRTVTLQAEHQVIVIIKLRGSEVRDAFVAGPADFEMERVVFPEPQFDCDGTATFHQLSQLTIEMVRISGDFIVSTAFAAADEDDVLLERDRDRLLSRGEEFLVAVVT